MTRRFKPIWGKERRAPRRPGLRPAAAAMVTDGESGDQGVERQPGVDEAALRALQVRLDRGLLPKEEYDARRSELLGDADRPSEGVDDSVTDQKDH